MPSVKVAASSSRSVTDVFSSESGARPEGLRELLRCLSTPSRDREMSPSRSSALGRPPRTKKGKKSTPFHFNV
jgi:hypothetical protein